MRVGLPLWTLLVLSSCAQDDRLLVDVRTDLVPGLELDALRAVLDDGSHESVVPVSPEDDAVAGVRVLDLSISGEVRVEVEALRGGRSLLSRRADAFVAGRTGLTVTLDRDCRGIVCPAGEECRNDGACVSEECVEVTPACGAVCERDTDCPGTSPCAEARCVEGGCLAEPAHDACPVGSLCDPVLGCRRPAEPVEFVAALDDARPAGVAARPGGTVAVLYAGAGAGDGVTTLDAEGRMVSSRDLGDGLLVVPVPGRSAIFADSAGVGLAALATVEPSVVAVRLDGHDGAGWTLSTGETGTPAVAATGPAQQALVLATGGAEVHRVISVGRTGTPRWQRGVSGASVTLHDAAQRPDGEILVIGVVAGATGLLVGLGPDGEVRGTRRFTGLRVASSLTDVLPDGDSGWFVAGSLSDGAMLVAHVDDGLGLSFAHVLEPDAPDAVEGPPQLLSVDSELLLVHPSPRGLSLIHLTAGGMPVSARSIALPTSGVVFADVTDDGRIAVAAFDEPSTTTRVAVLDPLARDPDCTPTLGLPLPRIVVQGALSDSTGVTFPEPGEDVSRGPAPPTAPGREWTLACPM